MATNKGFYTTSGSRDPIPAPPIDYIPILSVEYTDRKSYITEVRKIFQPNEGYHPYIMVGYWFESITPGPSETWVKAFPRFLTLIEEELSSFIKACYRGFDEEAIISFITPSLIIYNDIARLALIISKDLSPKATRQLQSLLKFYVKGLKIREGKNV